jgi:hypothetical protein
MDLDTWCGCDNSHADVDVLATLHVYFPLRGVATVPGYDGGRAVLGLLQSRSTAKALS